MFNFRHGGRHGDDPDRRHVRKDFWFGDRHGHGHQHMRGGRLGRLFEHGDLRFVILHLIAEKPRHGYEIIKAIEERVGGAYSPSPGTIYPALTLLEEQGYIAVEPSEGSKKLYAVTGEGKTYLDINRGAVDALLARMDHVGARHGGDPAPQVIRAVENLKTALHLRLTRGPLTEEQIRVVAEALDRAAGEIERS